MDRFKIPRDIRDPKAFCFPSQVLLGNMSVPSVLLPKLKMLDIFNAAESEEVSVDVAIDNSFSKQKEERVPLGDPRDSLRQ